MKSGHTLLLSFFNFYLFFLGGREEKNELSLFQTPGEMINVPSFWKCSNINVNVLTKKIKKKHEKN
jgi:hypothetical protein